MLNSLTTLAGSEEAKIVVNPYLAMARLSPTELVLLQGPFSHAYIHLSFDAIEKCDQIQSLIEKRMKEPVAPEVLLQELEGCGCTPEEVEALLRAGLLVPSQALPLRLLFPSLAGDENHILTGLGQPPAEIAT